jgi:hypothetical protein
MGAATGSVGATTGSDSNAGGGAGSMSDLGWLAATEWTSNRLMRQISVLSGGGTDKRITVKRSSTKVEVNGNMEERKSGSQASLESRSPTLAKSRK